MEQLTLGYYRPVYLWAGAGTRRMNRLKFMGAAVDDKTHDMAHTEEGAERIAAMGFNWVYLTCNWGFPPEIEEPDWESFRRAVKIYHQLGIKVSGYVQSSNCVYTGSYKNKDWYALDPHGKKIHYYTGRYLTSLNHQGWRDEVRNKVQIVVEAGADGVFFDNPWLGGAGEEWHGAIVGNIGCYHPATQNAYATAHEGRVIPLILDLADPETQRYLRWRSEQVTETLRYWADYARQINPNIMISANNFDTFNRNALVEVGIDIAAMSTVQDVMLIENFALPRLLPDGGVVSNAAVIGAAQAHCGTIPVTTVPYERGIGFDNVYPPRTFTLSLLESAAMNAPLVVKGTEYLYRKMFTLLIHHRYKAQQQAIGKINTWLGQHADWLSQRTPTSPLAIYHPYHGTIFTNEDSAPYFYGACETLFQGGLPFRVVGDDDWSGVQTLIVPPGFSPHLHEKLAAFTGTVIALGEARPGCETPLWPDYHAGWRVPKWRPLRRLIRRATAEGWAGYHRFRLMRKVADWMRIPQWFLEPRIYHLPPAPLRNALLKAIGEEFLPRVTAEAPVLFTMWQEPDGRAQYYVVNYHHSPQQVTLHLPTLTAAEIYTPGAETLSQVVGSSFILQVDTAKISRSVS